MDAETSFRAGHTKVVDGGLPDSFAGGHRQKICGRSTSVRFRPLGDPEQIQTIILARIDPLDKAGEYAIQGARDRNRGRNQGFIQQWWWGAAGAVEGGKTGFMGRTDLEPVQNADEAQKLDTSSDRPVRGQKNWAGHQN